MAIWSYLSLHIVVAVATVTLVGAEKIDFRTFRQAVLDSVNENTSFQANFVEILALLCPVSVYCPGDPRREDSALSNSLFSDSKHNMSAEVLLARDIVKQNAGRMTGCCEPCNCMPACAERNNCCPTYPREAIQMTHVSQTCSIASASYLINGYSKQKRNPFYGFSYYMVNNCFLQDNAHLQEETFEKCRHPNVTFSEEITPVFNEETNRIYRNKFCAQCNNEVNNTTSWELVISAPSNYAAIMNDNPESLYKIIIDSVGVKVDIIFQPPASMITAEEDYLCVYPPPVVRQYDMTDGNWTSFLERACIESKSSKYYTTFNMYNNVFCLLLIDASFTQSPQTCIKPAWKFGLNSFTAILNVHESNNDEHRRYLAANKNGAHQCSCSQHFDRTNGKCRDVLCPFGYFRDGCACRKLIRVISGMKVKLYAEVLSDTLIKSTLHELLKNKSFFREVEKKLSSILCEQCGSVATIALVQETSDVDPDFYTATAIFIITTNNGQDARTMLQELSSRLQAGVPFDFLRHQLKLTFGINFAIQADASTHTIAVSRNKPFPNNHTIETMLNTINDWDELLSINRFPTLSQAMFCQYIKLYPSEVEKLVNISMATGYTPTKLSQIYNAEDSTMCEDDFNAIFTNSSSKLGLFSFLFLTSMVLSISIYW